MTIAYNIIGAVGSLLILLGFYRTSIRRWSGKSLLYELDNLLGAALIVVYQVHLHAYVTVVLNVIWVIVAFRGATSIIERQQQRKARPKHRSRA